MWAMKSPIRVVSKIAKQLPLKLSAIKTFQRYFTTENNRLKNKFEVLHSQQSRTYFNEKWDKNISSKVLTDQEKQVLGKGLKYNCSSTKSDVTSFIARRLWNWQH